MRARPASLHGNASAARLAVAVGLAAVVSLLLPATAQQEARLADELVALTNVDRTSNGLPALAVDRRLAELAVERSQDMARRGYFSHSIPPDGRMVFELMQERGIVYRAAGENLERNTAPGAQSVRYAQRDFMNSPSHRALILSQDMDHLGAGAALAQDGAAIYTVLFAGLGEPGPDSRPAPLLGGADAAAGRRGEGERGPGGEAATGGRGDATRVELPIGRLRPAQGRPLGLIEVLVQWTLRLYLGM